MSNYPLREFLGCEDTDELIKKISGKLTKLYDAKTGETNDRPWSIQNGEIELEGFGPAKIVFFNNEQDKSMRGSDITIKSTKDKRGMNGLTYVVETYRGKETEKLKVISTAEVSIASDNEEADDAGWTDAPSEKQAEKPAASKPAKPMTYHADKKPMNIVAGMMVQASADIHKECHNAVMQAHEGTKLDNETTRAYVNSVFIEANKQGAVAILYQFYNERGIAAPEVSEESPDNDTEFDDSFLNTKIPGGADAGKSIASLGKDKTISYYKTGVKRAKDFSTEPWKSIKQFVEHFAPDELDAEEIPF